MHALKLADSVLFLSTLSLRRATTDAINGCNPDFISIHALLAESDSAPRFTPAASRNFYPRSPCGERQNGPRPSAGINNFYPRSPCGERHGFCEGGGVSVEFLSTLSLRRATPRGRSCYLDNIISIHALLAESD